MKILSFAAWAVVQVFLFSTSIWFVVFGLRNWNDRKYLAIAFFIIGFGGIFGVVHTLAKVGLL